MTSDFDNPDLRGVVVPGDMTIVFNMETGQVVRMSFMDDASNAGYFGPTAVPAAYWGPQLAELDVLELENTEGPFWKAVQAKLAELGDGPAIHWVT